MVYLYPPKKIGAAVRANFWKAKIVNYNQVYNDNL